MELHNNNKNTQIIQ